MTFSRSPFPHQVQTNETWLFNAHRMIHISLVPREKREHQTRTELCGVIKIVAVMFQSRRNLFPFFLLVAPSDCSMSNRLWQRCEIVSEQWKINKFAGFTALLFGLHGHGFSTVWSGRREVLDGTLRQDGKSSRLSPLATLARPRWSDCKLCWPDHKRRLELAPRWCSNNLHCCLSPSINLGCISSFLFDFTLSPAKRAAFKLLVSSFSDAPQSCKLVLCRF